MDNKIKNIGFIIQARLSSERLPGKVLMSLPIEGEKSILEIIIDEINRISENVIVATSTKPSNKAIVELCKKVGCKFYQGSEDDVLQRFIKIQEKYNFQNIVRLTADNPFIDSKIIEKVLKYHIKKKNDYTQSVGLPLGMNVEVFTGKSLLLSTKYIQNNRDKEHVTLALKREDVFKKDELRFKGISKARVTVDTIQDYTLACMIRQLSLLNNISGLDLIEYININHPWLWNINQEIYQKNTASNIQEEFQNALLILNNLEYNAVTKYLRVQLNE